MTTLYSSGPIESAAIESTVSMANVIEIAELQTTSAEKLADCGSTSLKDQKRHAVDPDGSSGPPEKKKLSAGESLKRSNKVSNESRKSFRHGFRQILEPE